MALKLSLKEEEKYGLSEEECKLATRWLRQNKTRGVIPDLPSAKLFELFLLGEPLSKLAVSFPQYPLGQIAFTAAYRGWPKDRDRMLHTLQDRVKAKVVKSVLDQVDFLTTMMGVANAEHLESMTKYIQDPINNPKPSMRIESIKEFKDVSETLYKIVSGATTTPKEKASPMFDALTYQSEHKRLTAKSNAAQVEDEKDSEVSLADLG